MKLPDETSWSDIAAIGTLLGFLWLILRRIFTYVGLLDKMEVLQKNFDEYRNKQDSEFESQNLKLKEFELQLVEYRKDLRTQSDKLDIILKHIKGKQ